jgi:hypothetical protein
VIDELIDGRTFSALPPEQQQRLVGNYCRSMMGLIESASSQRDALRAAEEHCSAFDKECSSDIIRSAVRTHVAQHIAARWSTAPAAGESTKQNVINETSE